MHVNNNRCTSKPYIHYLVIVHTGTYVRKYVHVYNGYYIILNLMIIFVTQQQSATMNDCVVSLTFTASTNAANVICNCHFQSPYSSRPSIISIAPQDTKKSKHTKYKNPFQEGSKYNLYTAVQNGHHAIKINHAILIMKME